MFAELSDWLLYLKYDGWPYPQAQQETQKAALRYERAVSMHTAAREMVYVAEQGLLADRNTLDPTWQEMLNHATAKVRHSDSASLLDNYGYRRWHKFAQKRKCS